MSLRTIQIRKKIAIDIEKLKPKRIIYDRPETLTKREIEEILNVLPEINSPDREAAEYSLNEIKKFVREQLINNKVVKSGIPEFKRILKALFIRSKIAPGVLVGILAAQALIAQLMQSTLNTFHTAGSSKNAQGGINAYKDALHVRKEVRDPTTYIYFKDTVSFDDIIYKMRPELVQINISDITKETEILEKSIVYNNGFLNKHYNLYASTHSFNYDLLSSIQDVSKTGTYFLRIKLDVNKLYAHKLTTDDIYKSMMEFGSDKIICVPSPVFMERKESKNLYTVNDYTEYYNVVHEYPVAYLDVYVITDKVSGDIDELFKKLEFKKEYARYINETYIDNILIPSLKSINVKGVENITNLYPETISVWGSVEEEINNGDKWIIRFNDVIFDKTGITKDHVKKLLNEIDIKIIREDKYHMEVKMPEIPVDAKDVLNVKGNLIWSPSKLINYMKIKELDKNNLYADQMRKQKKELINERKFVEAGNISTSKPTSSFEKSLYFVYAVTDGNNIKDLINNDILNNTRIISNDIREILYTFGVEAARSFIIENIYNIIKINDAYIDPRHISLISDVMTLRGFITPVNPSGMAAQSESTLWMAGQSHPSKHLRSGALMGQTENVQGIYSAMIAGAEAPFGSALSSVSLNKKLEKEFIESSDLLASRGTDADTLSKAIEYALSETQNTLMIGEDYFDDVVYQVNDSESGALIGTTRELSDVIKSPTITPSSTLSSPSLSVAYIPKITSNIISSIPETMGIKKDTILDVTISSLPTRNNISLPGSSGINVINTDQPTERSISVSFPVNTLQSILPFDVLGRISDIVSSKK